MNDEPPERPSVDERVARLEAEIFKLGERLAVQTASFRVLMQTLPPHVPQAIAHLLQAKRDEFISTNMSDFSITALDEQIALLTTKLWVQPPPPPTSDPTPGES